MSALKFDDRRRLRSKKGGGGIGTTKGCDLCSRSGTRRMTILGRYAGTFCGGCAKRLQAAWDLGLSGPGLSHKPDARV